MEGCAGRLVLPGRSWLGTEEMAMCQDMAMPTILDRLEMQPDAYVLDSLNVDSASAVRRF